MDEQSDVDQQLAERTSTLMEELLPRVNGSDIIGVGVDAEVVSRFTSPPLSAYLDEEIEYCRAQPQPNEAFAGTWCVKEATVKALGGHPDERARPLGLRHVRVRRVPSGALHVALVDEARAIGVKSPQPMRVLGSVSYVNGIALAVVVITHR